jgi:hypothetical protein
MDTKAEEGGLGTWCGVWPALHVRKFDKVEQKKGYLFLTAFQEADGGR